MTNVHARIMVMGWLGMEFISSYHPNGPHVMMGQRFKVQTCYRCSEADSPKSNVVRILSFPDVTDVEGVLFNCQHFYLPEVYKI